MAIDGELIRRARESRGKSQSYLADLIEKDQTYISKLEKNRLVGGLKGDELLAIAKDLKYNPLVFSGDLLLEEGSLENEATIRGIITRMNSLENTVDSKLPRSNKIDPVCERVMKNGALYDFVVQIQFWDASLIQRLVDYAAGIASERTKKEKRAANG